MIGNRSEESNDRSRRAAPRPNNYLCHRCVDLHHQAPYRTHISRISGHKQDSIPPPHPTQDIRKQKLINARASNDLNGSSWEHLTWESLFFFCALPAPPQFNLESENQCQSTFCRWGGTQETGLFTWARSRCQVTQQVTNMITRAILLYVYIYFFLNSIFFILFKALYCAVQPWRQSANRITCKQNIDLACGQISSNLTVISLILTYYERSFIIGQENNLH